MNDSLQNKPLVTNIYTADPSAHVFEDKIYIYPSHDLVHECIDDDTGDQYNMEDYHILCMDNPESPCKDLGEVLNSKEVPWVSQQLWAPDVAYKNGKYYLVFPAKDKQGIFRIGIATSDEPAGKYTPEANYIEGSYSVDPCIFLDNEEAYLFFGGLWGGQLERWQTGEYLPDAIGPKGKDKAMGPRVAIMSDDMLSFKEPAKEVIILDAQGEPIRAEEEEYRYFEDPWVHKYKDTYYLSYSTGSTHYIVYATSKNPMGPYTYQGRILEPVIGWTTHHSIVEYHGKWYLFYHDSELSKGVNGMRCVKFCEMHYLEDGKIETITPFYDVE